MKTINRKYPFNFHGGKNLKPAKSDVFYEKNGKTYSQFYKGQLIPESIYNEVFGTASSKSLEEAGQAFNEAAQAEANKEAPYDEPDDQELFEKGSSESTVDAETQSGNILRAEIDEAEDRAEEESEDKPKRKRHKSIIKK